jgi:hypothetical protein
MDSDTQSITPLLIAAVARSDTNEDINIYIGLHGLDGLAVALEYIDGYVDGTVTHCVAALEFDLSQV